MRGDPRPARHRLDQFTAILRQLGHARALA
jgi:hypothetical protein